MTQTNYFLIFIYIIMSPIFLLLDAADAFRPWLNNYIKSVKKVSDA